MTSFEAEGHAELNPMCLGEVIFSAKELTKEPTSATKADFLMAEKASHAEIVKTLEERATDEGSQDSHLGQLRELYAEKEAGEDTNLTIAFLGGLQNFVKDFKQRNSLN